MMMGGNSPAGAGGHWSIQRALDIVRNCEGYVDPSVYDFLDRAVRDVWARLQAAPDTYILNRDEFALFNYYRDRFPNSDITQRAIRRFWENYHDAYGVDVPHETIKSKEQVKDKIIRIAHRDSRKKHHSAQACVAEKKSWFIKMQFNGPSHRGPRIA
ncbi:hypothetical protein K402DRAFT_419825 [Aulographum hederae CBS 113979]|uniref:Uncharacterized protein n=1 Tax=Aulographum hederae CBS 113979 TaxID=1176131 RepID=A0A6G1H421_9PEZI|nr:hypothetical protein K402DRAFT_419825 [Aulographum hederae CBS 113979]